MTANLIRRKNPISHTVINVHHRQQDDNKSKGITSYPVIQKNVSEEKLKSLKLSKQQVIDILLSYNVGTLKDLKALRLKPATSHNEENIPCLTNKLFDLWNEYPEATEPLQLLQQALL